MSRLGARHGALEGELKARQWAGQSGRIRVTAALVGGVLAASGATIFAGAWHAGALGRQTVASQPVVSAKSGHGSQSLPARASIAASVSYPTCQSSQLTVGGVPAGPGGGGGSYVIVYAIHNVSSATCTLDGNPSFQESGLGEVATSAVQLPGAPQLVVLAAGGEASFYLLGSNNCPSGTGINPYWGNGGADNVVRTVEIGLPGSTHYWSLAYVGAASYCVEPSYGISYIYPGIVFVNEQPQQDY